MKTLRQLSAVALLACAASQAHAVPFKENANHAALKVQANKYRQQAYSTPVASPAHYAALSLAWQWDLWYMLLVHIPTG